MRSSRLTGIALALLVLLLARAAGAAPSRATAAAATADQKLVWQPWFAVRPSTKTAPGAPITAVWRNQSHLDLFMTDSQGVVQSTWWDAGVANGYRPEGWFPIHSEMTAAPGAPVTAVWRNSTHLDLFVTDSLGAVQSIFLDDNGDPPGYRPEGWFPIHSEMTAAPGAPVTAVWRTTTHLDLFVTDRQGVVQSTFLDDNGDPPGYRPEGWFPIHPEMTTAPRTPVTAVWRTATHLDLFVTDHSGVVQSIFFDDKGSSPPGYRADGWFAIHPEMTTAPGTAVTALWRSATHLDLFVTDHTGVIQSIFLDDLVRQSGYRPEGWFAIHAETKAVPGSTVTALRRIPSHLDLFVTDSMGVVQSIFLDGDGPDGVGNPLLYRAEGWFPIHAETKAAPGSAVTALWTTQASAGGPLDHLDLFTTRADGAVQSTWWLGLQPGSVDAPTCTRFFRQWARQVIEDDAKLTACEAFMGITQYCAERDAFPAPTYNDDQSRRVLACAPYGHPNDDLVAQFDHLATGIGQGLADAAVGVAPFVGPVIEGAGCAYGVVFACAVLAVDIAEAADPQIPSVVGEALQLGNQAAQCVDGDVLACARLGAKGASAAGLQIPGTDAVTTAADAQRCGDGDFAACVRLGQAAADAAGIDLTPVLGTAADVQSCANGDAAACARLGTAAAGAAGVPLGSLTAGAQSAAQCASGDTVACTRLGKAVADAAGVTPTAPGPAVDALNCALGDMAACASLGRSAAQAGGAPLAAVPQGATTARLCIAGDVNACTQLGQALTNAGATRSAPGNPLSPTVQPQPSPNPAASATPNWPRLAEPAQGAAVRALQYLLQAHGSSLVVDGQFGAQTTAAVRAFQQAQGLTVDGIVGPQTWQAVISTVQRGSQGAAVKAVQATLSARGQGIPVDGDFGAVTDAAVRAFQQQHGLVVDGIVGPQTWQTLLADQ